MSQLDYTLATKKQLLCIAMDAFGECSYEERYDAARELQSRRFDSSMMLDLVRMYPHYPISDIAEYLGLPVSTIAAKTNQLGLKRRKDGCCSG